MFEDLDTLLRTTKGSLAQTPLEELFEAVFQTQRTCAIHLKRQALEKTIAFERGSPVGCTSNLVQESIGRVLVEKQLLKEEDYQVLLNASAEQSIRFEAALAQSKLLDPQTLEKQLHLNLAQKILDCFGWTDASYAISGDVQIDPEPPRIHAGQMLFTAVCTALPDGVVRSRFPVAEAQRWAAVDGPRHSADELKLSSADAAILDALSARPTFAELCRAVDQGPDAVRRRLYAFALLGLAEHAERVPAASAARPRGKPARARPFAAAFAGAGLCAAIGAAVALHGAQAPAQSAPQPPPLVLQAPRAKPPGVHQALEPLPPLAPAPPGARPRPDRPRGLALSASGIAFEPPAPGPRATAGKMDVAGKLLKAGRGEAALALYQRVLKAAPKSADAAFGAALAHYQAGRDEEARAAARRAVELAPAYAQAHLLLGYLEQLGGRAPQALEHYRRCVELAPGTAQAKDVQELADQIQAGPGANAP